MGAGAGASGGAGPLEAQLAAVRRQLEDSEAHNARLELQLASLGEGSDQEEGGGEADRLRQQARAPPRLDPHPAVAQFTLGPHAFAPIARHGPGGIARLPVMSHCIW